MTALEDLLLTRPKATPSRPWPRLTVSAGDWRAAAEHFAIGRWTLLALWAEPRLVHMAVLEDASKDVAILSLECQKSFPSIGSVHAPAIRLERTIQDLVGLVAEGLPDSRPWLDHNRWKVRHPLASKPSPPKGHHPYRFLPVDGPDLHQIPVGPVHAGIIEPGHFRFTACGETVVRLEERLGYVHRGVERLMIGKTVAEGARIAGRASGDSTVAYALAFARAVEAATECVVSSRVDRIRAVMAELERIANHLGDIGAICNDAAFALMLAHLSALRERVLRAANTVFGHRLMMDVIVPGGVTRDISKDGTQELLSLLDLIQSAFPKLVELYDNTASLQDRTARTGIVSRDLVRIFGAGGYVGRASGRGFDARKFLVYPPYGTLGFDVSVREEGDVNARIWVRIRDIEQSIDLIRQLLTTLPGNSADAAPAAFTISTPCEGQSLVEGFRGDIFVWLRLDADGNISRCHLRDPSCFQWPLLEAAIEGNIVADFPLCNKSFNCSYAGHDL